MSTSSPIGTIHRERYWDHPGHAIRAMREAQDLSLRALGQLSGTNASYLSQVERGTRYPTAEWLWRVTQALGKHMAGAK